MCKNEDNAGSCLLRHGAMRAMQWEKNRSNALCHAIIQANAAKQTTDASRHMRRPHLQIIEAQCVALLNLPQVLAVILHAIVGEVHHLAVRASALAWPQVQGEGL